MASAKALKGSKTHGRAPIASANHSNQLQRTCRISGCRMTPTKSGLCVNHCPKLTASMSAQKVAALGRAKMRKATHAQERADIHAAMLNPPNDTDGISRVMCQVEAALLNGSLTAGEARGISATLRERLKSMNAEKFYGSRQRPGENVRESGLPQRERRPQSKAEQDNWIGQHAGIYGELAEEYARYIEKETSAILESAKKPEEDSDCETNETSLPERLKPENPLAPSANESAPIKPYFSPDCGAEKGIPIIGLGSYRSR